MRNGATQDSPPSRKPPQKVLESRDPKSVRYTPTEWAAITEAARLRDADPAAFARDLSLMGLQVIETPALMEAYVKHLAVFRANGVAASA